MKNENQNIENIKIPIEHFLKKDFYVDILIDDKWHQGYIVEEKPNDKYDILYLSLPNKILNKLNITRKGLAFFGNNYYDNNNNIREVYLNPHFNQLNTNELYDILLKKLTEINLDYEIIEDIVSKINVDNQNYNTIFDKYETSIKKENPTLIIGNNNEFNITAFYTYQFFSGFLIDAIISIIDNLKQINNVLSNNEQIKNLIFNENFEKLIIFVLNIIIFNLFLGLHNIANIKNNVQFNRKNLILDKVSSILISIESIIYNILIIFYYDYFKYPNIEKKLKIICYICYEIILNSTKNNNNFLPIQFLFTLINFIICEDNIIRIENFDKNKIYKVLLTTLENINGDDIKYIKNYSYIKINIITIIKKLYKGEKNVLINNCYYSFLINSLTKTNILEKKIIALNSINDIIINFMETEDEMNILFNEFFINKNKIMNIFFEETVHDEILKRSIELFKYLAIYDKINEEFFNKLIKLNNNNTIRNILCEIISNLKNIDKKNHLFQSITKDFNFDNNDNNNNIIDFVSKLTLACFFLNESPNNNKLENNITNDNSSNNDSDYNKNIINDNINESRRINVNIQILKSNGLFNKRNQKKFIGNLSNNSLEQFMQNSTSQRRNSKKKNLKHNFKKVNKKNYYGLDLLFNYILHNYNEMKALVNNRNITKAIKAFKYILNSTRSITINDIFYFLDKLLDNISSNKKHNSVVQSLYLIEILLIKLLYCNTKKNNIYNINQTNSIINFNNLNINEEESEIILELDNKYNIISLIINDLIRYVSKVNRTKKNDNYKNEIFEGIYPYIKNISIRLKLIFFFVNFVLYIKEEEHIAKIYFLFKSKQFEEEKFLFFREITNNINYINYETLKNIFLEIFQNNTQFDISSFDDIDTFRLIKKLFIYINLYKGTLIDDTKTIRVNKDLNKLDGINYLFDILISNKNQFIQNKLCKMLSKYCLFLSNYKKDFCSKYWNNFINKITDLMEICNKDKNIIGILGLLQLIESIYNYNFAWKIPVKEETHIAEEPYVLYHFCCPQRNDKIYKLRVGKIDKIFHMRWKLAYYYDININDLVICDSDKNEYNFTNDDLNFFEVFPTSEYLDNLINVFEYPRQLLKIPNNPNELIEKNEKIINILIENLNNDNKNENDIKDDDNKNENNFLMKKKIWNIMQKLPKIKYIEKLIKQLGDNNIIDYENLLQIFNVNEIFVLTFNLKCIIDYLLTDFKQGNCKDKIKEKNNFLDIIINIHHIDRYLYNNLIVININNNNLNDENIKFIYFECIKSLLELIQIIEEYKKKKTISFIFSSNNKDKDKETIHTKYDISNEKEDDLEETKISLLLRDSIFEIVGHKILYTKLTDFIIAILNDNNSSNDLICFNLLQELFKFIEHIKNNYINNSISTNMFQNYFEFIFENEELFKKLFIFDFIKCSKEEVKKLLSNELLKNLFGNYLIIKTNNKDKANNKNNINNYKNEYIEKYFDIILTPEMFDYLVNNQNNGTYFFLISSIIEKYINYNKKNKMNKIIFDKEENNTNFIKIIDSIIIIIKDKNNKLYITNKNINNESLLTYPYKNISSSQNSSINSHIAKSKNKKNENDSLIDGILLYLLKILELSLNNENSVIIKYLLEKLDICDFFLINGILRKSNVNSLYINDYDYTNSSFHKIVFQIVIFILKYIDKFYNIMNENKYLEDSLYMKIWNSLNKFHKLGFWKKNKNFEITYNDCNRKEFVGLKNMSSTCYMNSILQQFFMIPMLRETILSIGNENNNLSQNTILYQLQLLFASLKTYDFKYYVPKNFAIVSNLSFYEQMDADEYYGQLIDKLEIDISNLFNKDKDKNSYVDLFKYFFAIKLTDELNFIECNHKRFNESFCYNIQLEVKNYSNINDSLKNYFKIEIMTGDNKINCEECCTKRVCHKQLKIKNLPNILVISLKRFDYDYKTMTKFKLNNFFEFPFELDMSEFVINSNNNNEIVVNTDNNVNENNIYELTGITIHYGVADFGHYYDLIKASNNKWYMFNDTNIKEFPENNIPKEAFGERENDINNDNDIEGENNEKAGIKLHDKKNAYILIYTKKLFKNNFTKNSEYKTKLVFPPYDKFSNINNNLKSIINYKMFKYWTFDNLSNSFYQNFIIELLKLDLVRNINKEIDISHINLIQVLKNDDYLPLKKYINTGNTIFSYGLLYFCKIMLKSPKDKNNFQIYIDILTIYLENDINKCLYLLEEFSDEEIIDEFFVSCKNIEVIKTVSELIILSFNNYLSNIEKDYESDHKKIFLFKFLNSIILFISHKGNSLFSNMNSLDNIVKLFCKLINKKQIFLKYLKNKGIDTWLDEIINKINNTKSEMATIENNDEDEQINVNLLLTNENFPKLESNHCILREKTNEFNFGINHINSKELGQIKKKATSKKGKNNSINSYDSIVLLRRLQDDIREIEIKK